MKKKATIILTILLMLLSISGCSISAENNQDDLKSVDIEGVESAVIDDSDNQDVHQETELGSFGIGPADLEDIVYVYSGDEIHIPFIIESMSEAPADLGLIMFVGGMAQDYKIYKNNEEISKSAFMQKFYIENAQTEEFDIVFTPNSGAKGDVGGIVFASIFKPDHRPLVNIDEGGIPYYGIFHSILPTTPLTVRFDEDAVKESNKKAIEWDIVDLNEAELSNYDSTNSHISNLDDSLIVNMYQESTKDYAGGKVIKESDGKINFVIELLGGKSGVTYNGNIYINNEFIDANDLLDFTIKVEKGKIYRANITLDADDINNMDPIYSIFLPKGEDYMVDIGFPVKSETKTIITE